MFFETTPFYDISSHTREQIGVHPGRKGCAESPYGNCKFGAIRCQYDPPLPKSILQFKSEKGQHQTQKPTTLINWILKYYSKENDIVLDPTMGSGSMGVACKEMNRKFIGIAMNDEIYNAACERLDYQTAKS